MGMKVSLDLFMNLDVIALGLALSIGAILGKQLCGLGVIQKTNETSSNRTLIGLGMIPRGEVGLIFALWAL